MTTGSREGRRKRVPFITMSAVALVSMLAGVFLAPAANAGGEGKQEVYDAGNVTWDLDANYQNDTSSKTTRKPAPANGKAIGTVTVPKVLIDTSNEINFKDDKMACLENVGGGTICYNFNVGIHQGGCDAYPPADANYSYNGNAIPLPARGQEGEKRLVSWLVKLVKTEITDITTYEITDPYTELTTTDTGEEVVYQYEYKWSCKYSQAPAVSTGVCATWVKSQLNGPYDQDMKPMKSVLEPGGTNTRVPRKGGGYGTEGEPFEMPSQLGKAMEQAGLNPKTDTPTLEIMQNYCIPNANDSFDMKAIDKSSTLGRYTIPSTTWYTRGFYYHFVTDTELLYPGAMADPRYKNGYLINETTPPSPTKLTTYAKLVCLSGTQTDGLVAKIYTGSGTAREWRVIDWQDGKAGDNYYSWNCGDSPVIPDEIRKNDFLQCDLYKQATIGPAYPQTETVGYSTRDVNCRDVCTWNYCTVYYDAGGNPYEGPPCTCRAHGTQCDTQRFCPAGFTDTGSGCSRVKTPEELGYETHGAIPESDNRDVYYSMYDPHIVVDHKSAAPIKKAVQFVDGVAQSLEFKDGAYQLPSTADPINVEWTQVRINVRDGRNVNEAGKNVFWEYEYRLAPWSSPKLKTKDVNSFDQPYHGWVDNTNRAAGIAGDRKWDPAENYTYQTMPYRYEYAKPTWHREDNPTPYTYHQESYQVKVGQHEECHWWAGYQRDMCLMVDDYETRYREVKDAPPAGCVDNGTSYICPTDVMDQKPAPWTFDGEQWVKKAAPPTGWHDDGAQWVSDSPLNDGFTGGIAFDEWRTWPTYDGLDDCVVDAADYNDQPHGKDTIKCGDNVTDHTRSAYFRYFMSSTYGSNGWQVTPWWKVTADVQTNYKSVDTVTPGAEGDAELGSTDNAGRWIRQSYECPGQPFRVNINRVVN